MGWGGGVGDNYVTWDCTPAEALRLHSKPFGSTHSLLTFTAMLRWLSLLLLLVLVLRESACMPFPDLGGFQTFSVQELLDHLHVMLLPHEDGSAEMTALYGMLSDSRRGSLPWSRLLARKADLAALVLSFLQSSRISARAGALADRLIPLLNRRYGVLNSWGPCPTVQDLQQKLQAFLQEFDRPQKQVADVSRTRSRTPPKRSPRVPAPAEALAASPRSMVLWSDMGPPSPLHHLDSPQTVRMKSASYWLENFTVFFGFLIGL